MVLAQIDNPWSALAAVVGSICIAALLYPVVRGMARAMWDDQDL